MKVVLVFASFFTVAFAGVGILTTNEELEALEMWMKHCSEGSDQGTEGEVTIYCKNSDDETEEVVTHTIDVAPGAEVPRQVVFVRPPVINYKHSVAINGEAGKPQKTTIYVLPQKNTHSLDYVDNRPDAEAPQKPSLYFLKSNPGPESESLKKKKSGGY